MKLGKVLILGHRGMVGSAIHREMKDTRGVETVITISKSKLNLLDQSKVHKFIKKTNPDLVILCAARVGGISANARFPANFIYENSMIVSNVIHSCFKSGVKRLLFLGSSCIYPKFAKQPIKEEYLLSGLLEPTNEPYAIAKILGIKLCESYSSQYNLDYRAVMPCNLYGPGDNYHPSNSHVIPGLINKFHEAKEKNSKFVSVWGTGKPRREFLSVSDLAKACIKICKLNKSKYRKLINNQSHINIGSGEDITIKELSLMIAKIIDFRGKIKFDKNKPDGTPRKLLDVRLIKSLGWKPEIDLFNGLKATYSSYKKENRNT